MQNVWRMIETWRVYWGQIGIVVALIGIVDQRHLLKLLIKTLR